MKNTLGILLVFSLMIASVSCRSTKSLKTVINKRDTTTAPVAVGDSMVDRRADSLRFIHEVLAAIDSNRIDFKTFSAKVKVAFEGKDGKKNDFNANIRVYKDSVMWISINALLGIEAFRVLITPDSVKVLNKLDKVVLLRSVSYLQEVAKVPFNFNELQDL
ncbi:MAG: DUF4292 domain-containing protein, partial [Flavitalea sp.]